MTNKHYDVILVGGGIMSATLATLLAELKPGISLLLLEKESQLATESSDAMNNAGTGHSAFCELNYTPQLSDGSVDISKATKITEQFEVSKQFWAYLAEQGILTNALDCIRSVPHCSIVFGDQDVEFLKKRYQTLSQSPLYEGMEYSEDYDQLAEWFPLVMKDRPRDQKVAGTYMPYGTDVNFGELTKQMLTTLRDRGQITILSSATVDSLSQDASTQQRTLDYTFENKKQNVSSQFIFLGAGGGSLPLLQSSGIKQRTQFGGFPVSGQWLVCTNPEIVDQHYAKVYGKASVGTPPMSVPHLDTRVINGKKELLFGPYAGFTTKYLQQGSWFDLFGSLRIYNIRTMIQAGIKNLGLTTYLIEQVLQSRKARLSALREYMPTARDEDWKLVEAGYRVQVIKEDPKQGGILQFGTEVVVSDDKTLATLLGASPGASTSVSVMISILESFYPDLKDKITTMIPSYGQSLEQDPTLLKKIRKQSAISLNLKG